jgi:hypothetical protein
MKGQQHEAWADDLATIERVSREAALTNYKQQRDSLMISEQPCMIRLVFAVDLLSVPDARPAAVNELSNGETLTFGMGQAVWEQFCGAHWLWCTRLTSSIMKHIASAYPEDDIVYVSDPHYVELGKGKQNMFKVSMHYKRDAQRTSSSAWF